jgi:putative ABC transport system permease protein
MLVKIAWRNIWRNKVRSFVVIIALALGLLAGTFTSGFYEGMMNQRIDSVIKSEMSHFQFHDTNFRDELLVKYYMKEGLDIQENLKSDPSVVGSTGRVISTAMMQSSNKSGGVKLIGISPDEESTVTGLNEKVTDGEFFEGVKRNPILISHKMAESYKLKRGSKTVIQLQDINGDIIALSFKVVGIYKSGNGMLDEMNAYILRSDLQSILGLEPSHFHEIAVLLNQHDLAEPTARMYQEAYPKQEVKAWLDLAVGMRYMVQSSGTVAFVIVGIILVALLFSIINTMLMAVMERTKELGMLMAVGMNKTKVFFMIMLETVFLSMIGGPLGLFVAFVTIEYFGKFGLSLGSMGDTYGEMGFATVVYTTLSFESYFTITVMVLIMALLAALYPARKALKLNPSEAIRKI